MGKGLGWSQMCLPLRGGEARSALYHTKDRLYSHINVGDGLMFLVYNVHADKRYGIVEIVRSNSKVLSIITNLFLAHGVSGVKCACCGAPLSHFHVERSNNDETSGYTMGAYTVKDGREIPFNWDHVVPKAVGGADHLDNGRLTCLECNSDKGADLEPEAIQLIQQKPTVITWDRFLKAYDKMLGGKGNKGEQWREPALRIVAKTVAESDLYKQWHNRNIIRALANGEKKLLSAADQERKAA